MGLYSVLPVAEALEIPAPIECAFVPKAKGGGWRFSSARLADNTTVSVDSGYEIGPHWFSGGGACALLETVPGDARELRAIWYVFTGMNSAPPGTGCGAQNSSQVTTRKLERTLKPGEWTGVEFKAADYGRAREIIYYPKAVSDAPIALADVDDEVDRVCNGIAAQLARISNPETLNGKFEDHPVSRSF